MKSKRIWALASAVAVVVLLVAGVLILPVSGATHARQEGCFPIHEVQPDETLDSIAELYGVSPPDLLAANQLTGGADVYAGQQLCIPTAVSATVEAPVVEATGATTETLTLETATPESQAVEAPAVEATGATTETLTVETVAPEIEASSVRVPAGVPTRICVEGQVIDKGHMGIAELKVSAQRSGDPGKSVQTEKNGRFEFRDLAPGQWVFRVQVPDSWVPVTSKEVNVGLDYGHPGCYTIRFKLDPRGCIIAQKTNENGRPLSGWLITVSGPVKNEVSTGSDGVARIGDLIPGTYRVSDRPGNTIPAPWIWTPVTPSEMSVQVKPAWSLRDCSLVKFQNRAEETSCITGFKVDDNHKPLAGWKVYAQPADSEEPLFSTTTAANGGFTFPNLPLGSWTVWEEVPDHWTPITPSRFTVTLAKPSQVPRCVVVRFKNRAPDLCAEGYKVDENGMGLAGWTVEASSGAKGSPVLTAVTDEEGYYRFNGLTLGEWVFTERHQAGWTPITPDSIKVKIAGEECCTELPVFRNHSPLGCIEGFKRDDLGFGLAGWNVTLEPESGGRSLHAVTDGTGHYVFEELPVGKYVVYEEQQAGWTPVTPVKFAVELKANDSKACARIQPFINKQVPRDICIDGYKLDKVDKVGLPDWPVQAKNLATGAVLDTKTDGIGYFRFSNLQPGEYEVTVGDKEGWAHVGPSSKTVTVAWPPQDACTTVKFYNRQAETDKHPEPDGRKDEPPPPDRTKHPRHDDGCRAVHTVGYGDTLNKIAAWNETSIWTILEANDIANADVIYPGQTLCIP